MIHLAQVYNYVFFLQPDVFFFSSKLVEKNIEPVCYWFRPFMRSHSFPRKTVTCDGKSMQKQDCPYIFTKFLMAVDDCLHTHVPP